MQVKTPELLSMGMVDASVETREEVLPAAVAELRKNYLPHPDEGRIMTKEALRGELTREWLEGRGREAQIVWDTISSEKTIASLTGVLKALGGGGKKAKM